MRLAGPGRAVVAANLNEWSSDGKTTNDWQLLGMGLDRVQTILAKLESAAGKPSYDSEFDYDKGFVDFQLKAIGEVRRACQILSWSVLYHLKQHNLEAAQRDLISLVNLTTRQTPEPLIICQLVRISCAGYSFNATWQALQAQGWSENQLAALASAWQAGDFVNDMALAMQMERALTLDFYRQIRDSREKLNFVIEQHQKTQEMTEGAFGELPTKGFVLHWLHLPVWRSAWAAQDELTSLEQWQFMIGRERLARTNGWAALKVLTNAPALQGKPPSEDSEKPGLYDRLRFLFASENFSVDDNVIRRTLEAQTQQQMALAVLAVHRYRLRNGKLPALLADLVPDFLSAPPRDFMNGKQLHYRLRQGDADFLLYSVGEDGADNGGDASLREGKKSYRQIWDGRDAAWPSPATSEEAQQTLGRTKHE